MKGASAWAKVLFSLVLAVVVKQGWNKQNIMLWAVMAMQNLINIGMESIAHSVDWANPEDNIFQKRPLMKRGTEEYKEIENA